MPVFSIVFCIFAPKMGKIIVTVATFRKKNDFFVTNTKEYSYVQIEGVIDDTSKSNVQQLNNKKRDE